MPNMASGSCLRTESRHHVLQWYSSESSFVVVEVDWQVQPAVSLDQGIDLSLLVNYTNNFILKTLYGRFSAYVVLCLSKLNYFSQLMTRNDSLSDFSNNCRRFRSV